MSILRRGEKRRKGVVALTAVGALFAFQALAIVGAGAAFAGTCNYNLSNDTVTVDMDPGDSSVLHVDDGVIELDDVACGSATNSNTAAIVVLGENNNNEDLEIDDNFD